MVELVKDKRVEGIDDIVDHSNRDGMRIVVELKRDVNPQVVLNQLYSFTQLQTTCGAIMLALVNGEPKVLTLKEMLQHYIDYQCEVVVRRTRYELRKAQERAHIVEALKVAIDFIDEVIAIIRSSKTIAESKTRLMERFDFDDAQATYVVQMRLGQLTGMERSKIEEELAELKERIADLSDILASEGRIHTIVKEEALAVRDKYVDDRRTEITALSGEVDVEDLIPVEECVLTLTHMRLRQAPAERYLSHPAPRRAGDQRDVPPGRGLCRKHVHLFLPRLHPLFSNRGRVYRLKAYEVPEGSRTSKGMNIVNLLPIEGDEKITAMIRVSEFEEDKYLCMVTKQGIIKRTSLCAYDTARKGGIIAITLDDGDELRWVRLTGGEDELIVATRKGMAIRFRETDARPLGRTARGVRAIALSEERGDEVVGMSIVRAGATLLTVTETGYGRRSSFEDYRLQSRAGKGITNYRTALYGDVAAIKSVDENDDIIMISSDGVIIRIEAETVNHLARPAKGVRVMRVSEGEKLVTLARAEHEEPQEEESEEEETQGSAPATETAE